MVEKYYNKNGELGVLISPGFGAGWSTWGCEEIAYDKRIIEYWLNERPSSSDMCKFLESLGYEDIYMGGYKSLTIQYIPRGTMFCIHEYDGSESIETPKTMRMMMA